MADIRVLKTNRILYKLDDATAIALIDAFPGEFERWTPPPKPIAPPKWGLKKNALGEVCGLGIVLPPGEFFTIGGDAATIRERCAAAIAGRKVELPSDELIAAYSAATGGPALDPDGYREAKERARNRLEEAMKEQGRRTTEENQQLMRERCSATSSDSR